MSESLRIYTGGACLADPGNGGWAWAIDEHDFSWNCEPITSEQRMELTAALKALVVNEGTPITIVTSSAYLVSCFRDEWWENWTEHGFKRGTKEAVANWDLWEPLLAMSLFGRYEVTYEKVRDKDENLMSDFAHELARKAANVARREAIPV